MQSPHRLLRTFWILFTLILIGAIGALIYVYRARVKVGLSVLVDETGSRTAAAAVLGVGIFALLSLIFWMVFPAMVYFGLKDLRRRAGELEQATNLCARQLAHLSDPGDVRREKSVRDQAPNRS